MLNLGPLYAVPGILPGIHPGIHEQAGLRPDIYISYTKIAEKSQRNPDILRVAHRYRLVSPEGQTKPRERQPEIVYPWGEAFWQAVSFSSEEEVIKDSPPRYDTHFVAVGDNLEFLTIPPQNTTLLCRGDALQDGVIPGVNDEFHILVVRANELVPYLVPYPYLYPVPGTEWRPTETDFELV